MTYTNPAADTGGGYAPTPGRGTAEFATPTEAGQAFNRGQRGAFLAANPVNPNVTYPPGTSPEEQAGAKFGAWRPLGQTGAEIMASKEGPGQTQERTMRGQLFSQEQKDREAAANKAGIEAAVKGLEGHLKKDYGTWDAGKQVMQYKPKDENMARDQMAAEEAIRSAYQQTKDPQKAAEMGAQHFRERQNIRDYLTTKPLAPGFDVNHYLDWLSQNPEEWRKQVQLSSLTRPKTPAPSFFSRENFNQAAEAQLGSSMVP